MKLSVSSASFAASFSALIPKLSSVVMASVVDAAYENTNDQAAEKNIESRSLGEECSFASSGLRRNEADTGILGCAEDLVCVEDDSSSLGGLCISAVDTDHRDLETCTTKCTGLQACKGLSQEFIDSNIGEGSCCGNYACSRGETICFNY